jgi:cytochrome c-L
MNCGRSVAIVLVGFVLGGVASARAQSVTFKHPLDDSPLEVKLLPGEKETDTVKEFHATGQIRYYGDATALGDGKELYERHCQSCHLPDGSGRLGPSLITDDWKYKRVATDVGMFEVIYAGAAGAMQSFFRRGLTQDETLKIIAYTRALKK